MEDGRPVRSRRSGGKRRRAVALVVGGLAAVLVPLVAAAPAGAAATVPTVTGPITGGTHGFPSARRRRCRSPQLGYTEQEYFFEGTASRLQERDAR